MGGIFIKKITIKIKDFLNYPDLPRSKPRLQVFIDGVLQEDVSRFSIDISEDELQPRLIKKGETYGLYFRKVFEVKGLV